MPQCSAGPSSSASTPSLIRGRDLDEISTLLVSRSLTPGGAMNLDPSAGPNPGLGTWPARRARISPGHTALLDPSRSLTYAELADRTARYAGVLRQLGVGKGDRVAYLGVNAVEVFETYFAAW